MWNLQYSVFVNITLNYIAHDMFDFKERYYRRLYDLVVASLKEKFGNSVAITPQDNIDDSSTDHSDHGNERQDHHKTELLATANKESSQTNVRTKTTNLHCTREETTAQALFVLRGDLCPAVGHV